MKYLLTGASGHLGQKIATEMLKRISKSQLTLIVHSPKKGKPFKEKGMHVAVADYQDLSTLNQAFSGGEVLIYIPSLTYDLVKRIQEFENVITAAEKNGIRSIVAMSFIADQANNPFRMAPFYAYMQPRLTGSRLKFAVVKNALYADPLVPYLPELIERQHLIYPVGQAALSFITQVDAAKAFAVIATTKDLREANRSFTLNQRHPLTMIELGKIMTKVTGHQIGYQPVSATEFALIYHNDGGAELASMYEAGARGLLAPTSNDFSLITGHQPQGMEAFLATNYQSELKN